MREIPPEVRELDNEILAFIHKGVDHEDADQFNRLALQVFGLQYSRIPLYQRYCDRRGVTPRKVSAWDQIPALATDSFKAADLALLPEHTVRTFMTSGTTRAEERGRVHFDEGGLRLMDATIQEAAAAFLFPDG